VVNIRATCCNINNSEFWAAGCLYDTPMMPIIYNNCSPKRYQMTGAYKRDVNCYLWSTNEFLYIIQMSFNLQSVKHMHNIQALLNSLKHQFVKFMEKSISSNRWADSNKCVLFR